jgi:hypothetical protein
MKRREFVTLLRYGGDLGRKTVQCQLWRGRLPPAAYLEGPA